MPKTTTTCTECGDPLHPNDPGVTLVGFARTDHAPAPLYRHAGACAEAAADRTAHQVECRGCRRWFDRRTGGPGRPPEFCGIECRRAHSRRIALLWRDAARGTIPADIEGVATRKAAIEGLAVEVRAGRFDDVAPAHAGAVLTRYSQALAAAEADLADQARRQAEQRHADQQKEWAEARARQAAQALDRFLDEVAAQ